MAIDAFLKLEGLKGESVASGHEGELDILSWSWGMSQAGTTHLATGGGAGKVNVQDMSFTHYVDSATPNLIESCCQGTHFGTAKLTLRKAGKTPLEYVVIEMKDVIVTSVSTGGSGGEELVTEDVALNFAEFKYIYQPQDKTGAAKGGSIETHFNIATNS